MIDTQSLIGYLVGWWIAPKLVITYQDAETPVFLVGGSGVSGTTRMTVRLLCDRIIPVADESNRSRSKLQSIKITGG